MESTVRIFSPEWKSRILNSWEGQSLMVICGITFLYRWWWVPGTRWQVVVEAQWNLWDFWIGMWKCRKWWDVDYKQVGKRCSRQHIHHRHCGLKTFFLCCTVLCYKSWYFHPVVNYINLRITHTGSSTFKIAFSFWINNISSTYKKFCSFEPNLLQITKCQFISFVENQKNYI